MTALHGWGALLLDDNPAQTALTLKDATYAGVLQDDSTNSSRRGNKQGRKARELVSNRRNVLWSHVDRHGREF